MPIPKLLRFSLSSLVVVVLLVSGCLQASAAGESVRIVDQYPTGAISPGTTVIFTAVSSGFTSPQFSTSDTFSASGATTGTIDKSGNFMWTPKIYDAGMHSITVSVTDNYQHLATTTLNIFVINNSILVNNISPGPTVAVSRPVTFTVVAPGFITPSYHAYDSSYMSTIDNKSISSSGAFSWTPTFNELGTHSIRVVVNDNYGHNAESQVRITVINPLVSIQSLSPGPKAEVGSQVSFLASTNLIATTTFSTSDFFTGTSTITASNINSAGVFSWKSSASDLGVHTITTTATDAYGNIASTSLQISITPATIVAEKPSIVTTTTASSSSVTTKKYLFTTNLVIGSRGTAVIELQKRLITLGYLNGTVTGYFGPMTAAAVKKFQSAKGLSRVGNVGPATRAALNKN